jgi:hypothetical protein
MSIAHATFCIFQLSILLHKVNNEVPSFMYVNGQALSEDQHFLDHIEQKVPVQVYFEELHQDIGYVNELSGHFIRVNGTLYNRELFQFVSRPGF